MRRRRRDAVLGLAAALAAVGLLRSLVLVQAPAAADLPAQLRRRPLQLAGYRTSRVEVIPPRQGRDVAAGPLHRQRFTANRAVEGQRGPGDLEVELVARRSRDWQVSLQTPLEASRLLTLGPREQVELGSRDGAATLRTCLVGGGSGDRGPVAAAAPRQQTEALHRWHERLRHQDSGTATALQRAATKASLQLGGRLECLEVSLRLEPGRALKPTASLDTTADGQLRWAWSAVAAQLRDWGEKEPGLR